MSLGVTAAKLMKNRRPLQGSHLSSVVGGQTGFRLLSPGRFSLAHRFIVEASKQRVSQKRAFVSWESQRFSL